LPKQRKSLCAAVIVGLGVVSTTAPPGQILVQLLNEMAQVSVRGSPYRLPAFW